MKVKGNIKRVKKPDFWRDQEHRVPLDLKEKIFNQYYSMNTLFIYCDSSCNDTGREMAVACTYVNNCSVIVKQQFVYPPQECIGKIIFGELKAVVFALTNIDKYIKKSHDSVVIFSDVIDIERLLSNDIFFRKNNALKKLHLEVITLYQKRKKEYSKLNIQIKYLPFHDKKYNPFMRASHNASRKMLRRK